MEKRLEEKRDKKIYLIYEGERKWRAEKERNKEGMKRTYINQKRKVGTGNGKQERGKERQEIGEKSYVNIRWRETGEQREKNMKEENGR